MMSEAKKVFAVATMDVTCAGQVKIPKGTVVEVITPSAIYRGAYRVRHQENIYLVDEEEIEIQN